MSILLGETGVEDWLKLLATEPDVLLSVDTAAEALAIAGRRGLGAEMAHLIEGLGLQVPLVTCVATQSVFLPSSSEGLDIGDCFADEITRENARQLQRHC